MAARSGAQRFSRPARPPALAAFAGLLALALAGGDCGRDTAPVRPAQLGAETEWSWLQSAKRQLDDERARLAQLAEPAASPRSQLARDVDARAQELGRRLVAYINADPPVEGARLSARQLAALRMKSDEDIAVARQFVDRAGDYRQAADILEGALAVDPRNLRLVGELARVQAARYMTAGRFSRAAPGMTADQVRAALGPPNAHDVRAYPDKQVVAWFYPRDGGAAAAVWFAQRDGAPTVYLCDWDALPPPAAPTPPGAPSGAAASPPGPPLPPGLPPVP